MDTVTFRRLSEVAVQRPPSCPSCGESMTYRGGTHGFVHCEYMLLYRIGGWLDEDGNVVPDQRLADG